MEIHLLDMGTTMYGDSVLVTHGGKMILIDGGHPKDGDSIRDQLKELLGKSPPFAIDLLVVTHCHSDHIGCLPTLVADGVLTAKFALVADEKLGWGRTADGTDAVDAHNLTDAQKALAFAALEEDHTDLAPDALADFLEDVLKLRPRYAKMLKDLDEQGTKVVRYGRDTPAKVKQIETALATFGLKVLGPVQDQLLLCAEALSGRADAVARAVAADGATADMANLGEAYKRLIRGGIGTDSALEDQPGPGAALNDQSIVIKVAAGGWSALLAGDMQFAKPEVAGLDDLMPALRKTVADNGPYDFIKLTHHTSYNGLDATVLDEWSDTKLFAHSGGSNDTHHPERGALKLLKSHQDELTFARTDRNGIVTVSKNGSVELTPAEGELNDFSPNLGTDVIQPEETAAPPLQPAEQRPEKAEVVRGGAGQWVEVTTRVPHTATTVTITIQVNPGEKKKLTDNDLPPPDTRRELKLGGGRNLPNLLFVTRRRILEKNIGLGEAAQVFDALKAARTLTVVDLPAQVNTAEQAAPTVRAALRKGNFAGVVLLGGFDVVPAHRLDVLDAATRQTLAANGAVGRDADNFIVWSDELYGDRDGDFLPEVPVTRIPDGRLAAVMFGALQAPLFAPGRRFGVRNFYRPFAGQVFPNVPGEGGRLEVSKAFRPASCSPGAAAGAVYLMLHGDHQDASRFWGENAPQVMYEAFAIQNVPASAPGTVVFAGCCWGALAMAPPAGIADPNTPLRPRSPESSIPIAYLRASALAFVGCTGSHYSPDESQPHFNFLGKPMHDAFWAELVAGRRPAEALFRAKQAYLSGMPHGLTDPFDRAAETKILRQFTCLGLGW